MLESFITYLLLFTHEFTDRSINLWHPTINTSHLATNQLYTSSNSSNWILMSC